LTNKELVEKEDSIKVKQHRELYYN